MLTHLKLQTVLYLYLWFAGFSGIGRVELLEHIFVLGLDSLLFVDVVDLALTTTKHQDHGARLDS